MKILVALGGNAILEHNGTGTAAEQFATVGATCVRLVKILRAGHEIAITHGNGPQVGDILLANEMARSILPPMPLDICGAESQGMIGYMIQQSLENELRAAGLIRAVATLLTQTIVDPSDPAFASPTKPIGPFYNAKEADKLKQEKGWAMMNDSNRGYRRLVPSPNPITIVEGALLRQLFENGVIVIAAGGGGIPVLRRDDSGTLQGVEAVIDKDLGAALLARVLSVDLLMILTDVEGVWLDYGKPDQRLLSKISLKEGRRYLSEGQFPPGSMGPKVEAALRFVESEGKTAVITSLDRAELALEGRAGTQLTA